jgi:phosphoenolpyruvate carboxylase
MNLPETPDKDLPLRDDIRLQGEPVFAIVGRIRRTSIRFHRDEDEVTRRELAATIVCRM